MTTTIKLAASPTPPLPGSPSPFSSNSKREFSFNGNRKLGVFLEEDGVYVYTFYTPFKQALPPLVFLAVLFLLYYLFGRDIISFYTLILCFVISALAAFAASVFLAFKGRNVPRGSNKLDWEQTHDARKLFYDWSQVRRVSLGKTSGRRSLSMKAGEVRKGMTINTLYEESQHQQLRAFLWEKIGSRLAEGY